MELNEEDLYSTLLLTSFFSSVASPQPVFVDAPYGLFDLIYVVDNNIFHRNNYFLPMVLIKAIEKKLEIMEITIEILETVRVAYIDATWIFIM